jgi:hypothetical protein
MLALFALLACTGSPPPEPPPPPAHFAGFDALVRATAGSRVDNAKIHARDLTSTGEAAESEAAGKIGAALGFVQVATDPADVADGVAKAAAACGSCHDASAVTAPEPPRWSHQAAAVRAAWGVVHNRQETPPDSLPDEVRAAWGDLAEVLKACQGCHPE